MGDTYIINRKRTGGQGGTGSGIQMITSTDGSILVNGGSSSTAQTIDLKAVGGGGSTEIREGNGIDVKKEANAYTVSAKIDNDTIVFDTEGRLKATGESKGIEIEQGQGIDITKDGDNYVVSSKIDNATIVFDSQGRLKAVTGGGGYPPDNDSITLNSENELQTNNIIFRKWD